MTHHIYGPVCPLYRYYNIYSGSAREYLYDKEYIPFRIGIKKDAKNQGCINIFGENTARTS